MCLVLTLSMSFCIYPSVLGSAAKLCVLGIPDLSFLYFLHIASKTNFAYSFLSASVSISGCIKRQINDCG